MVFETHILPPELEHCIESIFYYKDFISEHSIERVVPTGNIFMLIELDGFERHTYANDLKPNGTYRQAWVSGMQKKYLNISAHQHSEMLVVQFRPYGAYPFFKIPIHTLNNSVVQANMYFGDAILNTRNNLLQTENAADKFQIVDQWLIQLFDASKMPPLEISEVVTNLQNQPFSKQKEVLGHYPKTSKHLIDRFKKYCGLTPKALHRVFRFNTILAKINRQEEIVWTDIAYETGYADQSHFIKEFQEFCGFNPSQYIRNNFNKSMPNFFPLD